MPADAGAMNGQLPECGITAGERAGQVLREDVREVPGARVCGLQQVRTRPAQVQGSPAREEEQDSERQRSDDELAVEFHGLPESVYGLTSE